jgi:hypothetical protein
MGAIHIGINGEAFLLSILPEGSSANAGDFTSRSDLGLNSI